MKIPQMIEYVYALMEKKTMSFKLLKKCTEIWEIVSSLNNIIFDNEPVYGDNDKYIRT